MLISIAKVLLHLLLVFIGSTYVAHVLAQEHDIHTYFINEPVFGGQAYIVEAGKRENPAVVLVHGLNDSAELWRPFIPMLAKHFHVISFDLPGFGRSSKGNKLYSPANYVEFIHHVIRLYRHPQVRLVGHSLGGNIALHYAAAYPQQVERLTLIDVAGVVHRLAYTQFLTHFGIQTVPEFYSEQTNDLKSLANTILGTLADNASLIESGEHFMLSEPLLRENLLGGQPAAIAAHALMLSDVSDKLFNLSTPILLIWGEDDHVTPLRTAKILAANLPNAGLVILDGTGHVPMRERPERMTQLLLEYLAALPAQRDAMLSQRRYSKAVQQAKDKERIGHCLNESGKVFRGTYKTIVIENCKNARLEQVYANGISISQSEVTIEASVIDSTGNALSIENAEVVCTAVDIHGQPAILLANTKLDMAGSQIHSREYAIYNRTSAGEYSTGNSKSTILFSLSRLSSKYMQRYLHGSEIFYGGQGM